jgi:hypothetical protein
MQVKKKTQKKIKLLTLTRPAANSQLQLQARVSKFKLSLPRTSKTSPSLDASQKKYEKKNQTLITHRASYQLQLQARVSKFKLSLLRASKTSPSLDASTKKNERK